MQTVSSPGASMAQDAGRPPPKWRNSGEQLIHSSAPEPRIPRVRPARGRAVLRGVAEGMHVLAAFSLFALAFLILGDICLRLIGRPVAGTAELVANAVVAIAFLQLPHAVRCGGFLRVELLDSVLPAGVKRGLYLVSCLLGALLFFAVVYSSWPSMVEAWQIGEYDGVEGSLKVPTAPVRSILVLASVLAAVNFAVMFVDGLLGGRGSEQ